MLQDAWIDSLNIPFKYFIDVGACYPIKYSNSFILQEKGWSGLVIEPNPLLVNDLGSRESNSVIVLPVAVAVNSGKQNLVSYGALSSLVISADRDIYANLRKKKIDNGEFTTVNTMTFNEISNIHNIPKQIGYLSIDVEGLDFDILREFDLEKHTLSAISIEHNLDLDLRRMINTYMRSMGYRRVCRRWSSIDSWFVREDLDIDRMITRN
jgi:FkbM family methyltransferase